jgi:ribosomal protein S18 acetylase RimI-like enzyme
MSGIDYRELHSSDFDAVLSLWKSTPGLGIRGSDNARDFSRFLARNPSMSFAALSNGNIIGTILCGHDGRRGYIYHCAVSDSFRRQGIGSKLVTLSLSSLEREEIEKCTIFVFNNNAEGRDFWKQIGWERRDDLAIFQMNLFRSNIGKSGNTGSDQ